MASEKVFGIVNSSSSSLKTKYPTEIETVEHACANAYDLVQQQNKRYPSDPNKVFIILLSTTFLKFAFWDILRPFETPFDTLRQLEIVSDILRYFELFWDI